MSRPIELDFDISKPCTPTGFRVRAGDQYRVTFREVRSPSGQPGAWFDRTVPGTPRGIAARRMGWIGALAAPFRRVVGARYIQPLAEIRTRSASVPGIQLLKLTATESGTEQDVYHATFEAPRSGALFFTVNDVALPFGLHRLFYGNNRGTAKLTVTPHRPVSRHRTGVTEEYYD